MIKMESISKRQKTFTINQRDLIIIVAGFLISRVNILNKLTPFGIAYLGAALLMGIDSPWLPISMILGLFTFHGLGGINYYIAGASIYLIFRTKIKTEKYTGIRGAFLVASIFFLTEFLWAFLGRGLEENLLRLIFESILIFTMTYVFSFSLPIEKLKLKNINNEQLACSLITMGLILSGVNNVSIYGLAIKNIVSIIIVVFISHSQGVLLGVASSVVIGMISYISHVEMPFIISILGVGGLLAGLFRDLGRSGSILGFILGNGIISFYINKFGTSFFDYKELLISIIGFLLVSHFIKIDLKDYLYEDAKIKKDYEKEKEEYILKRLDKTKEVFYGLSDILQRSLDNENSHSTLDVYNLVDQISNDSCKSCESYKECWEDKYYTSYQSLLNLMGALEINIIDQDELIEGLESECRKPDYLIEKASQIYESFKEGQAWNIKLMEQRKLLSEQIRNLGKIIEDIKRDISIEPIFHRDLEESIVKELKNKRIDILGLTVVEIEEDSLDILIEIETSVESRNKIEAIKNIVSKHLDMTFSIDYTYGDIKENSRSFKLTKANRFNTFTTISKEANSENLISGDNYTFGEVRNTSFMAISDGMGIGKRANEESGIAIELIEKLMEINMDKSTIIKTINSLLRSRNKDEIFTTLDLGFIDLYTGRLQILKNGSPPTFIKKKDGVKIINSRSLPIGILENVDFHIYEEDLEDGDIIIMMSDGILESNRKVEDLEEWMRDTIEGINSQNPQLITDEILNMARFVSRKNHRDDMTIMAMKVWKNI